MGGGGGRGGGGGLENKIKWLVKDFFNIALSTRFQCTQTQQVHLQKYIFPNDGGMCTGKLL